MVAKSVEKVVSRRLRATLGARVCVIICTRDRAELLARALSALRSAIPHESEVVVVDSGSVSADTRSTAHAAGVRYVRSDVPGLSIARNLGLNASTREIVVFTDDDCVVMPGFLENLIAPFDSARVGATTGLLRDVSDASALPSGPAEQLSSVVDGLDAGHGALMAFRRESLMELGGFDPVLGAGRHFGGAEDMDAICRVLRAGLRVDRVPTAVVQHVFTRDDGDYLRLNRNYGLGIGAMCAKWMRDARGDGLRLTARVARRSVVRYLRRIRTSRARRGQTAYLRGLIDGLTQARRAPTNGLLFIDVDPPAAVELPISGEPAGSKGVIV